MEDLSCKMKNSRCTGVNVVYRLILHDSHILQYFL